MISLFTPEAIALLGIFCGLSARSFLPYLRKTIKENKPLKWQHRYSAMLIVSVIATIALYPAFSPPPDGIKIFVSAFSFGLTANWTLDEAYKWIRRVKQK